MKKFSFHGPNAPFPLATSVVLLYNKYYLPMEQHPVPQNVTSFQFRLIGDMTIKQFGYLAGGAILAFISFKLPLPFFFTWPLTVMFAFFGFGFAFIPIEERPMDVWVLSFLKNVYSPTQFIWHRVPPTPEPGIKTLPQQVVVQNPTASAAISPFPTQSKIGQSLTENKPVGETLRNFYTQTVQQPVQPKKSFLDGFFAWLDTLTSSNKPIVRQQSTILSTQPIVSTFVPTPVAPQKTQEMSQLEEKVAVLQKQLNEKTQAEAQAMELQKQKEQELTQTKKQIESTIPQKSTPIPTITTPKSSPDPTVKIFTPEAATRAGLPRLTTFSNVVTGIVKDNEGALLPGVLVTVKDKEGIPLRALKTNKLGQFAASTQLPNGVFLVEVEDPRGRFIFDRAQITLNGTVMPAIQITAKSKREIDRENLAKQIFGQTINT
jgi:hypothetical protein